MKTISKFETPSVIIRLIMTTNIKEMLSNGSLYQVIETPKKRTAHWKESTIKFDYEEHAVAKMKELIDFWLR